MEKGSCLSLVQAHERNVKTFFPASRKYVKNAMLLKKIIFKIYFQNFKWKQMDTKQSFIFLK